MSYVHPKQYRIENRALIQVHNLDARTTGDNYYLGDFDADKEWNENPQLARETFLHISAYKDLLSKDSLFLLGRTGTGKTAILRCIADDVEKGQIDDYKKVIKVSYNNILTCFQQLKNVDNSRVAFESLKMMMVYIINVHIMKELDSYAHYTKTEKIKKFLTEYDIDKLSTSNSITSTVFSHLHKRHEIFLHPFSEKVLEIQNDSCYLSAVQEMKNITSSETILVLIDSIDEYNICADDVLIITKSLISVCFDYHKRSDIDGIYIKVAIPSEIHTRLLDTLPGKQRGNAVTIQWRYREILRLIALRFFTWIEKTGDYNDTKLFKENTRKMGDYQLESFYNADPENGDPESFLLMFLPELCDTSLQFRFNTLAYIIRHTLKKPREIMHIFNSLIHTMITEQSPVYFKSKPAEVKNVIHAAQADMISMALSMYQTSYNGIEKACYTVLNGLPFVFTGSNLDGRLKEAESAINHQYDKIDIVRVLFESGLVGQLNQTKTIMRMNPHFENPSEIDVITANFEYQIKGSIVWTQRQKYVIHPLCYEHYSCQVDPLAFVYPDTSFDKHDVLHVVMTSDPAN